MNSTAQILPIHDDVENAAACRELLAWKNKDHAQRYFTIEFGRMFHPETEQLLWEVNLDSFRRKRGIARSGLTLLRAARAAIKAYEDSAKKGPKK